MFYKYFTSDLKKKLLRESKKMDDPYAVRKELEEEYYALLLQWTFYSRAEMKRDDFKLQSLLLINKIRDERNMQVFDLFGHIQFILNFFYKMSEKVEHMLNKIVNFYCFEHRGINTFGLAFFPQLFIDCYI